LLGFDLGLPSLEIAEHALEFGVFRRIGFCHARRAGFSGDVQRYRGSKYIVVAR
jgi:hypothetical protein